MVGHEEAHPERARHLNKVADLEVAEIVADHAAHRAAFMILQHPLHGERYVVVAGPLAVARACDRILARMMRPPVRIDAGRGDSDRLAFEHRKGHRAEIEHDVVGVVVPADFRHPDIAGDGGRDRARRRLRPIEIGVRTGGGPGRDDGGIGVDVERGLVARTGQLRSGRHGKRALLGAVRAAQFVGAEFRRQSIPAELRLGAVGPRARHCAPIVDAAGRARRHAGHAQIADVRVDHIVARIVGDRADRADRFAGVATDADFGVDQVLPDDRRHRTASIMRLSMRRCSRAFRPLESTRHREGKRSDPGERRALDDPWIAASRLRRSSR